MVGNTGKMRVWVQTKWRSGVQLPIHQNSYNESTSEPTSSCASSSRASRSVNLNPWRWFTRQRSAHNVSLFG